GVQSGTRSSESSSSAIDSTANPRDAVQDNSSVLKEPDNQPPPDTQTNPDIGTPGVNTETGTVTEKSDQPDKAQNSDTENLNKKDNPPLLQPIPDHPEDQTLTQPNVEEPI